MVSGYCICDFMAVGHDFHQSSSCSVQGTIFLTLENRNRDFFTDTIIGFMYYLRRNYGPNNVLWKDKTFLFLFTLMILLAIGRASISRVV
jgi:hypothetical protein